MCGIYGHYTSIFWIECDIVKAPVFLYRCMNHGIYISITHCTKYELIRADVEES